jgi:zinc protease
MPSITSHCITSSCRNILAALIAAAVALPAIAQSAPTAPRSPQPAATASRPAQGATAPRASSPHATTPGNAAVAKATAAPRFPAGGREGHRSVEGIDEYRLANGLQVLLVPDESKPTTTVNLTYRVGSRHENYGETGMAHLLEHLLFKGTPTYRNVWADFEKRGLAANGSTSYDRTNYTAHFSANPENLNWYLGWLADAMTNSFIARKDLDTEMTVVRNEMERGENRPDSVLLRQTMATMFLWHNYGKSTIGARSDVENVDIPRLQAFYRLYYQPDNATLIVSGKFEPAAVLQRVDATFGKIPKPTRKLPNQYTLDPAQDGERSVTVRRVGGVPLLFAGYHVPAGPAPDFAAVEVLAMILGKHRRAASTSVSSSSSSQPASLPSPGPWPSLRC